MLGADAQRSRLSSLESSQPRLASSPFLLTKSTPLLSSPINIAIAAPRLRFACDHSPPSPVLLGSSVILVRDVHPRELTQKSSQVFAEIFDVVAWRVW